MIGFPLAQMFCFGMTDYRRPADAAVVFGARVYADGNLSQALADRVRTACDLYQDDLVHTIVFSGGPGDGIIHETEGMRRMAMPLGVRASSILIDEWGLSTQATVRNTCGMFSRHGLRRVLVVSHFYHLPRIKLTYQRQGCEVYAVPAKETYLLTALPLYMLREIAAFWVYYARPLWPRQSSLNM
jgi:vancomycin permeability regulator SanA